MGLRTLAAASAALLVAIGAAGAEQVTVDINRISEIGVGEKIGAVVVSDGKGGISLQVAVRGTTEGQHGFHVHEKGDCGSAMKDGRMAAGVKAGDHFDPDGKKSHKGPHGTGHKGDLPVLTATAAGIDQTVLAPQLKLSEVKGRSLVIHEGGDNYSDNPENGGGKGRMACGVVPKQ